MKIEEPPKKVSWFKTPYLRPPWLRVKWGPRVLPQAEQTSNNCLLDEHVMQKREG